MIYNPDLDIHLLRAFVAVAELKSFTRAAVRLNRTQSAVSMQVRRLEQNLGKFLLTRHKGRVSLTADGELMLDMPGFRAARPAPGGYLPARVENPGG